VTFLAREAATVTLSTHVQPRAAWDIKARKKFLTDWNVGKTFSGGAFISFYPIGASSGSSLSMLFNQHYVQHLQVKYHRAQSIH